VSSKTMKRSRFYVTLITALFQMILIIIGMAINAPSIIGMHQEPLAVMYVFLFLAAFMFACVFEGKRYCDL